jgi:hypothetical protein
MAMPNAPRPFEGAEFVKRYLRHVLPRGMRAIRYLAFAIRPRKETRAHRLPHRPATARRRAPLRFASATPFIVRGS